MVAALTARALGVIAIVLGVGGAGCGDNDSGAPASCLPECPASRGYDAEAPIKTSSRIDVPRSFESGCCPEARSMIESLA